MRVQPSTKPVPLIIRRLSTEFGRRHVKGVAITRLLVASWLVILASTFCASGRWWGALLFVAAALVGSLAYLMPRWETALVAENAQPSR